MEKGIDRIQKLEAEIATLPRGYISKKNIKGSIKKYHQWTEDGKKKSKYIDEDSAAELEGLIERRRLLQDEVRKLKKTLPKSVKSGLVGKLHFKTNVLCGKDLKLFVDPVRGLEQRDCFNVIEEYLERRNPGKVFILYGLRRTGKTTLIKQAIASLSVGDLDKTAFIQVKKGDTLGDINTDLKLLSGNGYRNVFIDEVTFAEDFIEGAALLSDIYAASGMKIILSGTDSLGFIFSESEELYDRCIMLHTTFIPYREFERVLGITGIDEYIRYGGTMSLGGKHYNETVTFKTKASTDEYIDSAIARNIQHSLAFYQDGGHFRHLAQLYDKNELTSAINRVVEDINHRFTIEVLTNDFVSHDLGISRRNLRKDRENPTDILDRIDKEAFTNGLRRMLDILNKEEQSVQITDTHRIEIKEYLDLLDLTVDIATEFIPVRNEKMYRTAVAQPGMRYSQAEALVRQLLLDKEFQNISAKDRKYVLERIMNEIKGRMMEDIILLETKAAYPEKEVFRLQFAVGEFDMVVVDPASVTCEIYEIKHSKEPVPEQYKNLINDEKCEATEFRFGDITRKAVIYRGEDMRDGDIEYLNVEEYLRSLLDNPLKNKS
ncbi:MAG: AAA family ATPase [Lachnospiraceae bacterium]|nr:AAA family ATPase [Lachnospiraceae bacterium]